MGKGEPYGGTLWGNPPPTRATERLGEPAPNAGYREAIVKDIEKAIGGYCQGYRKGKIKGY